MIRSIAPRHLVALLLAVSLAMATQAAFAPTAEAHWKSYCDNMNKIKWRGPLAIYSIGAGIEGQSYADVVRYSAQDINVTDMTVTEQPPPREISWGGYDYGSGTAVGFTRLYYSCPSGDIGNAEPRFNFHHTRNMGWLDRRTIAAHEFQHALGPDEDSLYNCTSLDTIMQASLECLRNKDNWRLQPHDEQDLNNTY